MEFSIEGTHVLEGDAITTPDFAPWSFEPSAPIFAYIGGG